MQRRRELARGVAAVIGAVILIAIMVLFIALYISSIERLGDLSREALSKIGGLQVSSSTIRSVEASWSYNGTHAIVFVDNQASKAVLVVSIAMVYRNGSYTVFSRQNKSINALVSIGYSPYQQLQLPLPIPPATQATIAIRTSQEPATISLAVEASPITAIIVPEKERTANTSTIGIEPTAGNGTSTWIGKAAKPIDRTGTNTKKYPTTINSTASQSTCNISRTGRGAVVFTDFESYPVPGWSSNGGSWNLTSGYKGNGLRGQDNGGGLGGASQYYYNTDLSSYSSLWVSVKTIRDSSVPPGQTGYYGIALMDSAMSKAYTIEIYYEHKHNKYDGELTIRSYNVEDKKWETLNSTPIPSYNTSNWYVIVARYEVTTSAVNIYAWLYDTSGRLVASLSASSTSNNRFTPAYIGVTVNDDKGSQKFAAIFDDFIASTTDPRYITIQNTAAGHSITVYDNMGNIVNSTIATTTTAIGVVTDTVVGTGVDGRIIVSYPDGAPCLVYSVPQSDAILGGDSYSITWQLAFGASFSDTVVFSYVVKVYRLNITINITANTTVSIADLKVNGSNCNTTSLSVPIVRAICLYPSGISLSAANITVVLWSQQRFAATIYGVNVYALGYYKDSLFNSLIVGVGGSGSIAFYNLSPPWPKTFKPVFIANSSSIFDGSTALTYDSNSYVLYIVNRSGVFSWNPLGWNLVSSSCRSIGVGAAINSIGNIIAVFPGGNSSYICVIGPSGNRNIPLNSFKLYAYTSSAVYRDSIVFSALDSNGTVNILLFNTTTSAVARLWSLSIYSIAGVSVDDNSSKTYIVFTGTWRCAKPGCSNNQYIKVFAGSLKTGFYSYLDIPVPPNASNILGYGNRVGIYRNNLLVIDNNTVLLIDLGSLDLKRFANAYPTW